MVDRDLLARVQVILLECALSLTNCFNCTSGSGRPALLAVLTGSTHRTRLELRSGCLETSRGLREGKGSGLEQELDLFEREMSEAMVPAEELFFGSTKIDVSLRGRE